jgi:hypothetical protein
MSAPLLLCLTLIYSYLRHGNSAPRQGERFW